MYNEYLMFMHPSTRPSSEPSTNLSYFTSQLLRFPFSLIFHRLKSRLKLGLQALCSFTAAPSHPALRGSFLRTPPQRLRRLGGRPRQGLTLRSLLPGTDEGIQFLGATCGVSMAEEWSNGP